mgnify:FL=1
MHERLATCNGEVRGMAGSGTSNRRVMGDVRVTAPWTLWGGNRVTASLTARYDVYNCDNTELVNTEIYCGLKARFLPSGYLEWSLPMLKGGSKWSQVIEPRARLTIMPDIGNDAGYAMNNDSAGALLSDATLFSNNRFSGLDLWENGTFADYGVRWAAFDNSGQNFEVFIGQSYDFTDRPDVDPNSGFHNGQSDYVGRLSYKNSEWLNLSTRFRFAENDFSLRHSETAAYVGTSRNFVSVGHIWAAQFLDAQTMDKDIHEITAGLSFHLTERFGVRFNAIYNVTDDKFQRHTGGVFYNHPCYFLSLEYRRDNAVKEDYVGNTTFQFRFGLNIDGAKL